MKKFLVVFILLFAMSFFTYTGDFGDKSKIIKARAFKSESAPGNMLRVSVYGRSYDIDKFEFPNEKREKPKFNLTWEEAKKTCENAGKRLCTDDEWTYACQGAPLYKYSYGRDFIKEDCNNLHHDRKLAVSGGYANCKSDTGIYDMAGNLWEWVDVSKTGARMAKGGSFRDGELSERCKNVLKLFKVQEPYLSFDNFGVRCCRDVDRK